MKFTVAATLLATSVTATSGSDQSVANDAASASRRELAVSLKDRFEVISVLKERRAFKNTGKVIRNLRRKLQQRQLGNEVEQDSQVHEEEDLDLGIFSRGLQVNLATQPEEELSVMEQLIEVCGDTEEIDKSLSCTCADLNVEAYTASVTCAYAENCLSPTEDICGGNTTFCFLESYNLEVTAPGTGSSATCYELTSPLSFKYCYGLTYTDESTTPSGCVLEVEGNQCNSCEFYFYDSQPNVTCNNFDCSNADETIGSGIICGDDTIVSAKIEDHLTYAPLPCEGGCNICPSNGEMSLVHNNVTMMTGDVYQCWQLNLAAQAGYLQGMPGDLCNSLLEVVNEPCGCVVPPATEVPEVTPTSNEDTNPEAAPTDAPMSSNKPTLDPTNDNSAAPSNVETPIPTRYPTNNNSAAPSNVETPIPTRYPTNNNSPAPSNVETPIPTRYPTNNNSPAPSNVSTSPPTHATAIPIPASPDANVETTSGEEGLTDEMESAIVGSVIGGVFAIIAVLIGIYFKARRKRALYNT